MPHFIDRMLQNVDRIPVRLTHRPTGFFISLDESEKNIEPVAIFRANLRAPKAADLRKSGLVVLLRADGANLDGSLLELSDR